MQMNFVTRYIVPSKNNFAELASVKKPASRAELL